MAALESAAKVGRIFDKHADQEKRQHADGQVDVENPAPGIAVGDPAAQGGADDRRDHDAHAVDGHGRAVLAGGKLSSRMACARGCMPPPPTPLQDAGKDEHGHVDGEAAKQRGHGEEHDGEHEQALATDAAGDPAGGGQHDGVRNQVAGEHPGGFVGGGGEIAGDMRQGDVGDRGVEHHHEGGGHHGGGDHPAIRRRGPRSGLGSGACERDCGRGGQSVLARCGEDSGLNKLL